MCLINLISPYDSMNKRRNDGLLYDTISALRLEVSRMHGVSLSVVLLLQVRTSDSRTCRCVHLSCDKHNDEEIIKKNGFKVV